MHTAQGSVHDPHGSGGAVVRGSQPKIFLTYGFRRRWHVDCLQPPAMITILIADDEPHITTLVRVTLEDERIRVVEACNGEQALDLLDAMRPDLVLLDVNMPGIDGFEVCRRIRADGRYPGVKIVMLTAAAQAADRARGRAAGADEYLTKPVSPIRLLALTQALAPECVAWLPR